MEELLLEDRGSAGVRVAGVTTFSQQIQQRHGVEPRDGRLMLIDDDDKFAATLKRSFERRDYAVAHVRGLEEALAALETFVPR